MAKVSPNPTNWHVNGGPKQQMKDTNMLLKLLNCWMRGKVDQQLLHPPSKLLLFLPFVVRRATNHNPVGRPFQNAGAAARCNIATKSANERIGVQEGTNKSAND